MFIFTLSGHLSPAFSTSIFTDATGGYPGGVWCHSLLCVTARLATRAPVTALFLRGRRCTAANGCEPSNHARTATSVAPSTPTTCQSGTFGSSGVVADEQARGGVALASTRTRDMRTEARQTAPVLCSPAMANDHPRSRGHAMTPLLAPTKTR